MRTTNKFGVTGLTVRLHNDFDNIPEFQYPCERCGTSTVESKLYAFGSHSDLDGYWICNNKCLPELAKG